MFLKNIFLAALFFSSTAFSLDWQYETVDRVIDSEYFSTRDGSVVKILGYDGPDPYFPTPVERGVARRVQRLLKLLLENSTVQLLAEKNVRADIQLRHVKLDSGQRLAEFLIERGYGRADTTGLQHFSREIERAELRARRTGVGIWGESSLQRGLWQQRHVAGRNARIWHKKFGVHCAGSSIGRVKKVIRGDLLEMEDGVRVRLLGVDVPDPDDARRGYACFGMQAKNHLATLVLGKKVQLEPDRTSFNGNFELPRYVWILGNPRVFGSNTLINRKMIADGFGRSRWSGADNRLKNDFEMLQRQVYVDPRGAWVSCSREILKK